jgi:hypothetical protein
MKNSLVVVFLIGLAGFTYAEKVEGMIFYPDGDKEEVIFDLPVVAGKINYFKLQEKVKFSDSFGEVKVLRPEKVKELRFTFNDEKIRMISLNKSDYVPGSPISSSENIFLKLEVKGNLSLFYYEGTELRNTQIGSYYSFIDNYILKKEDGSLLSSNLSTRTTNQFRKIMMEYFSDCPELVTKIEKKEFERQHIREIVGFYNSYCK